MDHRGTLKNGAVQKHYSEYSKGGAGLTVAQNLMIEKEETNVVDSGRAGARPTNLRSVAKDGAGLQFDNQMGQFNRKGKVRAVTFADDKNQDRD